jgi:hypothetical protein
MEDCWKFVCNILYDLALLFALGNCDWNRQLPTCRRPRFWSQSLDGLFLPLAITCPLRRHSRSSTL